MVNITIFTGPMKSGKSEALLSLYNKYRIAEKHILLIKPKLDNRTPGYIASRNNKSVIANEIETIEEIVELIGKNKVDAIFIDEFQFLKGDVSKLLDIASKNIEIFIAGLNLTAERQPFGLMDKVMCFATKVVFFTAICEECKQEAQYTYCKVAKDNDILVGDSCYEPVCEKCYEKLNSKDM